MNKNVLLVDMDGVLTDFIGGFNKSLAEYFPDVPQVPNVRNTFMLDDYLKKINPVYESYAHWIMNQHDFFMSLPRIEGAKKGLNTLRDSGKFDDVYICTMPMIYQNNPWCIREKCRWIQKYLGTSWVDKIIFTRNKSLIKGSYLIDDRPDMTEINPGAEWKQVLFETGYSEYYDLPSYNWKTLISYWLPRLKDNGK